MTVLFFILYCACIWSILGAALCCADFVVFKHLRAVKAGLRARGIRVSERVQAEQVQDPNAREGSCRNGNATDIVPWGRGLDILVVETPGSSDEQWKSTAGFSRFGNSRCPTCDQKFPLNLRTSSLLLLAQFYDAYIHPDLSA